MLIAFNLQEQAVLAGYKSLTEIGKLELSIRLEKPLTEPYLLFVYGLYQDTIAIDSNRNVSLSYVSGNFG